MVSKRGSNGTPRVSSPGWQRNLYTQTRHPDNFTPDDCFLAAIQRNKNVNKYSLSQCVPNACQVSLQLCSVLLFQASYACLSECWLPPSRLLGGAAALAAAGYLVTLAAGKRDLVHLISDLKHVVVFSSFGFGLAPVLYKLTDTISTDTIHTASFLALFLHLLTHNYHTNPSFSSPYKANALSLNASLFASVCLASRLSSSWDAFVLLTLAVIAFVLHPLFRAQITRRLALPAALASTLVTVAFSSYVSLGFAIGVVLAQGLVMFVAPALFVRWQGYKDTIHGPWDEAVPNI